MTPLHIPDGVNDMDNLTAALAYANAGWYLLPVRAGTKHPGSIVGDKWPSMSSGDPKNITAWFAGTDHGIALHCGRSGAVVLDVDEPDNVPDEVLLIMQSDGPYQSTRVDQPDRGHYLLLNDTGRRIGNSLGKLATEKKWGEVRGANGVIVVAPTKHPDGGQYRWVRTGVVPAIPDYLAEALPESATPEDTATDAQVKAFLDTHTETTKPEALSGLLNALKNKLAQSHSCHMSTLGVLTDAMQEAAAGYYSAREAARQLYGPYLATVTAGTSTGRILTKREAAQSYKGIVAWAIGQAEPNAAKARERVAAKYRDTVIEIAPEDIRQPPEIDSPLEAIEEQFWTARESLKLIYDAALSQMCSPWAVLACAAARTLSLIPPHITLPPIIGGKGSLNWFAAIVAKSGGGKGAANAVAAELVPGDIHTRGAGSGEGMVEAYDRRLELQDHIESILFSVDEVDSLASMQARTGQTTMSVLRSGFSGETLGYSYRNRSKEKVEAHTYRMTMIVSVQPERAAGLFADTGGGTPQRFMWFPGRDRRITADAPPWPTDAAGFPSRLPPIDMTKLPHRGIQIPAEAEQLIRQAREESMRGDDEALDGHALFCREKFAYAIALFDGRTEMDSDDWKLSGIAARVSDWCRLRAQNALNESQSALAAERGRLRGVEYYESEITRAVIANEELKRILKWAVGKLRDAENHRLKKRDLSRAASSRDRAKFTEAMLRGVEAGLLVADGAEWVLL
ncbi:MAG TPA: bifunctional DNA primase/polymerase [Mycolicibacterium fallax]|nr:bifunctional DNA primase/polymerase [Mycolicibacterium fallax]